jgi:hypothetical protein
MGTHFREQDNHAEISRRSVLKSLSGGAALAVVPAVALAKRDGREVGVRSIEAMVEELRAAMERQTASNWRASIDGNGKYILLYLSPSPISRPTWSGPGLYRLIYDDRGRIETFWVDRYWAEDDCQWMYAAAWRMDGHNVGPRKIYSEGTLRIVERLKDDDDREAEDEHDEHGGDDESSLGWTDHGDQSSAARIASRNYILDGKQ